MDFRPEMRIVPPLRHLRIGPSVQLVSVEESAEEFHLKPDAMDHVL